jgi:Xanthomonas XOO_2897-like deaminase
MSSMGGKGEPPSAGGSGNSGNGSSDGSGNGSSDGKGDLGDGQVPYGSTDLSQKAMEFRQIAGLTAIRNVAVYEYRESGVTKTLAMASERGVGHAERLIAKKLADMSIQPGQVTRIYSELEPCVTPGGYCKMFLANTFPQAEITYSFEYGSTQASRKSGVGLLKNAIQAIFQ